MSKRVPLRIIAKAVSDYYELRETEIFRRTRKRHIKDKRYIFFSLAKYFNGNFFSLEHIGQYAYTLYGIEPYDHSTVLYGIKQAKNYRETEPQFLKEYNDIKIMAECSAKNRPDLSQLEEIKSRAIKKVILATEEYELLDFLNTGT